MAPGETRERILEVARRLFHEQGYHATGVSTILREADVRSGSLYYFFENKEELLKATLRWYLEHLGPIVLAPAEQATDDPIGRVFALLDWYRTGLGRAGCTLGCPIGNLALELGDGHPEVRALIHENFQNWAAGVERWLQDAGDRLPPWTDRAALARFVLTVMEGGIMQSRAAGSLAPFDDSVRQLRAYFDALERAAASQRPRTEGGSA
ncbi:MAG: TetR/AcrR family transcriptional regulator [Planctomycetota bacterium]|nr:MAG: TetR/AcrR family transcriptional regulator [Planctomycetota bacterium]